MIALDASVLFGAVERNGVRKAVSKRVIRGGPNPFVTTEACMAEAMHLARSRTGLRAQDEIWQIVVAVNLSVAHANLNVIEHLMRRYRDIPMDFADATLVAFASKEPRVRIATFDSDFLAYRRDDGVPVPLVDDRLLGWEQDRHSPEWPPLSVVPPRSSLEPCANGLPGTSPDPDRSSQARASSSAAAAGRTPRSAS